MSDANDLVRKAYENAGYSKIKVSGTREFSNGDILVAMEGKDPDGDPSYEVCMISKGVVRIFDGDIDLINSIERPNQLSQWITGGHGVSAMAFFVTLIALIGFGLVGKDGTPAFDVLKQICLLAAGFFLGNQGLKMRQ